MRAVNVGGRGRKGGKGTPMCNPGETESASYPIPHWPRCRAAWRATGHCWASTASRGTDSKPVVGWHILGLHVGSPLRRRTLPWRPGPRSLSRVLRSGGAIQSSGDVFSVNREFNTTTAVSGAPGSIWQARDTLSFDIGMRLARADDPNILELRAGLTDGFPL